MLSLKMETRKQKAPSGSKMRPLWQDHPPSIASEVHGLSCACLGRKVILYSDNVGSVKNKWTRLPWAIGQTAGRPKQFAQQEGFVIEVDRISLISWGRSKDTVCLIKKSWLQLQHVLSNGGEGTGVAWAALDCHASTLVRRGICISLLVTHHCIHF